MKDHSMTQQTASETTALCRHSNIEFGFLEADVHSVRSISIPALQHYGTKLMFGHSRRSNDEPKSSQNPTACALRQR